MPDARGIAVGLVFGTLTLALLFAGQALSFAAWWLGRAITGGVTILFAFGVGYAVYELYSGWTATSESRSSSTEWNVDRENSENKNESEDISQEINDQELDEELEKLKSNTDAVETETTE
jgi:type VI protein secretion system component VasK